MQGNFLAEPTAKEHARKIAVSKRIILIGCCGQKEYRSNPKRGGRVYPDELYVSPLFKKRVAYAERHDYPWYVISAGMGLWCSRLERNPRQFDREFDDEVKPYDKTVKDFDSAHRAAWSLGIASQLIDELWEPWETNEADVWIQPKDMTIEIHAGGDYAEPLASILRLVGVNVELPCKGLSIGKQLALYGQLATVA